MSKELPIIENEDLWICPNCLQEHWNYKELFAYIKNYVLTFGCKCGYYRKVDTMKINLEAGKER